MSEPGSSLAERDAMNPTPMAGKGRPKRKRFIEIFEEIQTDTRPGSAANKTGSTGQSVSLSTNYVSVTLTSNEAVLQYQVDFTPAVMIRGKKFSAMRVWANQKALPQNAYVYDGGSCLYVGPSGAATIGKDTTTSVTSEGDTLSIRVYKVASLDPKKPQMMVLLNTQLTRFQEREMGLIKIQENCFDPSRAARCPREMLAVWPGFETAIGIFEDQHLMMCIDPRFRIVRTETAMEALFAKFNQVKASGASIEDAQRKAAASIKGSTVETNYNHKAYRVQDVDWTKSPIQTFTVKDRQSGEERQTTFADYFKQHYGVTVTDPKQPLLIVRPQNRESRRKGDTEILLVPQFCQMTGYTDQMRANFNTMRAIGVHTKLDPTTRKARSQEFVGRLNSNAKVADQLTGWGVAYGTEMTLLKGRNLGMQTLMQGSTQLHYDLNTTDWTRSMRGSRLEEPMKLKQWLILYTKSDETATRNFVEMMQSVGEAMRVEISNPKPAVVTNDLPQSFVAKCQEFKVDQGCELVFAVFPTNAKERYDALKQTLCCTFPCISQVVLSKTINNQKNAMSVATKVVLQINAKRVGQIWRCNLPFSLPTMVVGIDTHRDRTNRETVIVATATVNKKYANCCSFSATAAEDDDVLKLVASVIKNCLHSFKKTNGTAPKNVIVYRDGISDGQLKNMKDIELPEVLNMLQAESAQAEKKQGICCTYILVNKRGSTRFFVETEKGQTNPLSGTIVDHTITRPWRYDFYLVSQSVREGTVAPTYYNCVHDTIGMSPDILQNITYLLCHMYFNWPGTIRVPAPVQYAKKYAQLRALNLHHQTNEKLKDNLFYL